MKLADSLLLVTKGLAELDCERWPGTDRALLTLRAAVAYVEAQRAIMDTPSAKWSGVADDLVATRGAAWKALLAAEAAP